MHQTWKAIINRYKECSNPGDYFKRFSRTNITPMYDKLTMEERDTIHVSSDTNTQLARVIDKPAH